jgi:hypothetical protein
VNVEAVVHEANQTAHEVGGEPVGLITGQPARDRAGSNMTVQLVGERDEAGDNARGASMD